MSLILKILMGLVVLAGAGWLVWWSGWLAKPASEVATSQVATTTPEVPPEQNMNGMSAANDANDSALLQDIAAVDTQTQELTTDSASLDTAINDKPAPQAY